MNHLMHHLDIDKNILTLLEFDKILEKIASFSNIHSNQKKIKSTVPFVDINTINKHHQYVNDAIEIMKKKPTFSFMETGGINDLVLNSTKNKILSIEEIVLIVNFIKYHHKTIYFLKQAKTISPEIYKLTNYNIETKKLTEKINEYIDNNNQIKYTCTKKLMSLHIQLDKTISVINHKLEAIMIENNKKNIIQDNIITLRNDRHCLSIKASDKKSLDGIIHSTSDSGHTVFIEPIEIIKLGNDKQEIQLEIKKEIIRILKMIGLMISHNSKQICQQLTEHNKLDHIFAIAKYTLDCNYLNYLTNKKNYDLVDKNNKELILINACHPLINNPIPLNFTISSAYNAVAITGPNTGGKTITLKTIGLLVIMTLSGIPIPAAHGTKIPLYSRLFCDIGDEQSIQQSLSTFSAHIQSILKAINYADEKSLILLDELGAGTDPEEGSRLAISILDYLIKSNAHIVITTHHGEVKKYVINKTNIINASMEFDVIKLQPTYKIIFGLPGKSNAITIAKKLGLPESIINKANSLTPIEEINYNKMTDKLQNALIAVDQHKAELQEHKLKLKNLVNKLENKLPLIKDIILNQSQKQIINIEKNITSIDKKINNIEKNIDTQSVQEIKEEILKNQKNISSIQNIFNHTKDNYKIGDNVFIDNLNSFAEILSILDKNYIEVKIGSSRIKINKSQIRQSELKKKKSNFKNNYTDSINISPIQDPGLQIEIRGKALDIAIAEAEKFIDHATRFGHKRILIIHGKGSGTLKKLIRDILADHPLVEKFENASYGEGGAGVTIAYLEDLI
ncbi:MAG: DNA mismatch repair protein MutS2 [Chloroflexi bacterium]|jgi:DNA mismatch repair protein MutS2|nr:MAG: DNA mismatch repair protein MutS2 [Chloroflexota bacterium]